MKFLCLPGGFGNSKMFQAQLGPFCTELESDGSASFVFTQGTFPCNPPEKYQNYFGTGPHYRFIEPRADQAGYVLEAIREFPEADTPEDAMRVVLNGLGPDGVLFNRTNESISKIWKTMDEEGDVEGIIGFSEGALAAASLMLEEQRNLELYGTPRRIKCAMFLSGWPPVRASNGKFVFFDESEDIIQVPTLHAMSANDPMIAGSLALFNVCNMDNAEMFDHGNGHLVPREKDVLREMGMVVREMIQRVRESEQTE